MSGEKKLGDVTFHGEKKLGNESPKGREETQCILKHVRFGVLEEGSDQAEKLSLVKKTKYKFHGTWMHCM